MGPMLAGMNKSNITLAFLIALSWVALPWTARADAWAGSDEAIQSGNELYFREHVAPLMGPSRERAIRDYTNPDLYDPFAAPLPEPTPPGRTVKTHTLARSGGHSVSLVANQPPAAQVEY